MYKILYLPTAEQWPDKKSFFKSRETAQSYMDWAFEQYSSDKHLFEIMEEPNVIAYSDANNTANNQH